MFSMARVVVIHGGNANALQCLEIFHYIHIFD
jgi:hypothetical protein